MGVDAGNVRDWDVEARRLPQMFRRVRSHAGSALRSSAETIGLPVGCGGPTRQRQGSPARLLPGRCGLGSNRWRAAMSHLRIFRGHLPADRPVRGSSGHMVARSASNEYGRYQRKGLNTR
jgi:hypothetical protein